MTSPASSSAAPTGRLTKLDTLSSLDTVTASLSAMDMRRDSCSSSSSSVESCSPVTPTSEMMLSASRGCFSSASSSKGNDSSEEDVNPEPVFSSLPPRRVFPKTQSAGALAYSPTSRAFPPSPSSISSGASTPTSPIPARRIPSFPVSRPIRPFDSISNAMGTSKTYRSVSPPPFNEVRTPASNLEVKITKDVVPVDGPKSAPIRKRFTIGDEQQCLEVKQKSKRSTKLLEPPKNNRFQNGCFVLDMTQQEFKTRAW